MHIAGTLVVGCESRDVYCWCTHCSKQVQGCISLVRPQSDGSLGMNIVGVPTVECEPRDV